MRTHFRTTLLARAAILFMTASPFCAQAAQSKTPDGPYRLDVAIAYDATASGFVGGSTFWMQGGSAQVHGRFYGGWGVVADVAGMHIANINSTGVGLDMVTATFGPRYTWAPAHARYEIFGQGLAGIANGFNSVFPNPVGAQTVANSMAVKAGGGINVALTPRLALRAIEADWLRTQLPNSTNNVQNNCQLGAGIILRLR